MKLEQKSSKKRGKIIMKKVTFRVLKSRVTYLTINADMTASKMAFEVDGKINFKKAITILQDEKIRYLTGSVIVTVIDEKYRVPVEIVNDLLTARQYGYFVNINTDFEPIDDIVDIESDEEKGTDNRYKNEPIVFKRLKFIKPVRVSNFDSMLSLPRIEITEENGEHTYEVDYIEVPELTYDYLQQTFIV